MEYRSARDNSERFGGDHRRKMAARRRRAEKRRVLFLALTAAAVVAIFVMLKTSTVSATPSISEQKAKYYTSITIERNETLWDIAGKYYDSSYENRQDYIDNVKNVNGLSDDTIKTGNKLVIYYWVSNTDDVG
ncbi:MAG: LysM peptidoglycan-binding domain-containing protein [Lachnospiraceae bacterium]|jgi:LysM repeat protein